MKGEALSQAVAYLKCGNSLLENAAEDWADRHGYEITCSTLGGAF